MEKTTTYWLDLVYGHWLHCLTHTLTQFHMQIILSLLRMKASYSVMLKVYSWRFRNPPKTNMPNADRRLRGSFCRSPQHLKDRRKVPDSLSQSIPVTSKKYWPACGTTINQSMSFIFNAFYHSHSPKRWNVDITRNIILTHVHWLYCKSTK